MLPSRLVESVAERFSEFHPDSQVGLAPREVSGVVHAPAGLSQAVSKTPRYSCVPDALRVLLGGYERVTITTVLWLVRLAQELTRAASNLSRGRTARCLANPRDNPGTQGCESGTVSWAWRKLLDPEEKRKKGKKSQVRRKLFEIKRPEWWSCSVFEKIKMVCLSMSWRGWFLFSSLECGWLQTSGVPSNRSGFIRGLSFRKEFVLFSYFLFFFCLEAHHPQEPRRCSA